MEFHLPLEIIQLSHPIRAVGGRTIVVGGWARDRLLKRPDSKDINLEVYRLRLDELASALAKHGEVLSFGESFPVLQLRGLGVDVSLPIAQRFPDGRVVGDHTLSYEVASRRRDLTINAMGWDPLSGELLDDLAALEPTGR